MKKKSMTLLEIMIVIFLIGLISSILGYNMKGSLDKGRAFRTTEGSRMIREVLLLQVAEGHEIAEVVKTPEVYLKASGLINNPKKALTDGWGKNFKITVSGEDIKVQSDALIAYNLKHKVPKPKTDEQGNAESPAEDENE